MQILVEELRKHDWVHSLQFIDTAKVHARVTTPRCIVFLRQSGLNQQSL